MNEAAFLGGGTYVNIHTAAFPGGAIRGQLFSGGNVNLTTGAATGTTGVAIIENVTGGTGERQPRRQLQRQHVRTAAPAPTGSSGGPGNDTFNGDAGADVLVWSNGDGTDVMEGGADGDTVHGQRQHRGRRCVHGRGQRRPAATSIASAPARSVSTSAPRRP